jgi:hypothetical protein
MLRICLFSASSAHRVPLVMLWLIASVAYSEEVAEWRVPATIIDSACIDSRHSTCPPAKPLSHKVQVAWNKQTIQTRMVVPSANVRVGPFYITKEVERRSGTSPVSSTFHISLWARSPALYDSGQFVGATQSLTKIGETTEVLDGPDYQQKTTYVTVTLPGVFSAVQLRVESWGSVADGILPADCGDLPNNASNPESLDQPCLEVAVNPLAVLVPRVAPVSIIYEAPGNCSWANLTHTHAAGSDLTVEDSSSTATRTITDVSVLGHSVDHSDFTEEKVTSKGRESKVVLSRGESFGTALGLPLENPGNAECNNPNVSVPARENSGPGKGDVFVFLYQPALVYWNTSDMSNFLFTDASAPDHPRHIFTVTAAQIAAGQGLPPGISFTDQEKSAILALDPFTSGNWSPANLPERYIFLDELWSISQGQAVQQNQTQQIVNVGKIRQAVTDAKAQSQDNLDIATNFVLTAFGYGGGVAVKAAAGAAVGWLSTQWPQAMQASFSDIEKSIQNQGLLELFNYTNQTTTTTTYTRSQEIDNIDENDITQTFFVKDTNVGLNIGLFYDALFGTFAFLPWPAEMGIARSYSIRHLPSITWSLSLDRNKAVNEVMPQQLRKKIPTNATGVSIVAAPATSYTVSKVVNKGTPRGVMLRSSGLGLRGTTNNQGRFQALYYVLNVRGQKVAQLWINCRIE